MRITTIIVYSCLTALLPAGAASASYTVDIEVVRDLIISEGQHGKAVSLLVETVAQSPEGSEGFYLLGVARLWTGDCDAACEKFRRALEPDVILQAGVEYYTGRWGSPGKVTLTTRGTWTGVDWSRKDDLVRSR